MEGMQWVTALGSSAAAVTVVVLFLRHLASERQVRGVMMTERDERITKCVDKNSEAIDNNTQILGNVLEVLRKFNGKK